MDFHRCQIFVDVRQLNGLGRATDGRMLSGCPSEILLEVGAERQILFEAPIFFVAFVFLVLVLVLNDALLHRHSRFLDPFGEPRYARCSLQFFHRERFTRPLFHSCGNRAEESIRSTFRKANTDRRLYILMQYLRYRP